MKNCCIHNITRNSKTNFQFVSHCKSIHSFPKNHKNESQTYCNLTIISGSPSIKAYKALKIEETGSPSLTFAFSAETNDAAQADASPAAI